MTETGFGCYEENSRGSYSVGRVREGIPGGDRPELSLGKRVGVSCEESTHGVTSALLEDLFFQREQTKVPSFLAELWHLQEPVDIPC